MLEAHVKPCHMLETPKAIGASKAKIRLDEVNTEMDNQQVTQIELGWISGIIDGEGYLGITLNKNHKGGIKTIKVELNICNTDKAIIDKYVDIARRLHVNPHIFWKNARGVSKPVGKATIHRMAPLERLLQVVNPYLTGNKKIRGDLILEFLESRLGKAKVIPGIRIPYTEREREIILECLKLQKRGTSETIRKVELAMHQSQAQNTIEIRVDKAWTMLELHKKGKSQSEIARILGYSKSSGAKIGWWIRRLKNNETPIQKLGYFPQYSNDIVRPYVKA